MADRYFDEARNSAGSGQSRVKNNLVRLAKEQMLDANYNSSYAREYNRLLVKQLKASNPDVISRIKNEINNLAKRFIDEGWLH